MNEFTEDEVLSLIDIIATREHKNSCYAEYWWDSCCDCGLASKLCELSPRMQNAIDDYRNNLFGNEQHNVTQHANSEGVAR